MRKGYGKLLQDAGRFYLSEGEVYTTLRNLARRLDEEKIPYTIIGGMALAAHGLVRMAQVIEILVKKEGLEKLHESMVGRGYTRAFPGAAKSFRDADTHVRIEVITTGEFPGDGKPKPVAFPEPEAASLEREGVRVITLEKLVELKLASGMSAPHRLRDLADVQDLIRALGLPLSLQEKLDPSVREKFIELWHSGRA